MGPWGAKFIALGLVISLVGALLSWFLMCAEIIRVPATEGLMPRVFGKENAKEVPAAALWLTMLLVQLFLIWTYFNASTYTALILLASSLILLPYLLSALYQVIACLQARSSGRPVPWTDMAIGVLGTVYGLWLLYAAGLVYLLYTSIFYLLGLPFFLRARSEQQARPLLKPLEWGLVAVLVAMAAYAVYGLSQGTLSL